MRGLAVVTTDGEVTPQHTLFREVQGGAAFACVCHGSQKMGLHRIVAPIVQRNEASVGRSLSTFLFSVPRTIGTSVNDHM